MGFHWFIFHAAVLIKLRIQLFILKSTFDLNNRNYGTFCRQLLIFSLVRRSRVLSCPLLEDCCKTGKSGHAQNAILTANTKMHIQRCTKNSITFSSVKNRRKQNFQLLMVQFIQSGLKPNIFCLLNVRGFGFFLR